MSKKSLKGFLKTQHFIDRQKQRRVSDLEIIKAIAQGELTENDHGQSFLHGSLKVTVDILNSVLITVHPGDPSTRNSKVLTKEEARKIRELIAAHKLSREKTEKGEASDSEEFLKYVSEFSIRKL